MTEYRLTDAEYAEALWTAFQAAFDARFIHGDPDAATELGLRAGIAKVHEIGRRRGQRPRVIPA